MRQKGGNYVCGNSFYSFGFECTWINDREE